MTANIEYISQRRSAEQWTSQEDFRLMEAIAQGNAGAFTALVTRHINSVMRYAFRYVGFNGDAEDIAQETFIRLWKHAANWEQQGFTLRSWLYRITYNLCIDHLRKCKQTTPIDDETSLASIDQPDDALAAYQQQTEIKNALDGLPERQRSSIILCVYQGLTNIEAAKVMDISVEALESLLSRGRRALKSKMNDSGEATKE